MLSAQEFTNGDSSLFDTLVAGSDQAAAGPDQAARLLRQAKQQFQEALESEGKSLNSIATINDNETPTPMATASLEQFIVICSRLVGRSYKDSLQAKPGMAATLARQMSIDPCGEKKFPVSQTWWEVDPKVTPRTKPTNRVAIPEKG